MARFQFISIPVFNFSKFLQNRPIQIDANLYEKFCVLFHSKNANFLANYSSYSDNTVVKPPKRKHHKINHIFLNKKKQNQQPFPFWSFPLMVLPDTLYLKTKRYPVQKNNILFLVNYCSKIMKKMHEKKVKEKSTRAILIIICAVLCWN